MGRKDFFVRLVILGKRVAMLRRLARPGWGRREDLRVLAGDNGEQYHLVQMVGQGVGSSEYQEGLWSASVSFNHLP